MADVLANGVRHHVQRLGSGPRTVVARVRIRLVDEADIGPHAPRVVDARRVLARLRPVVGGEME